MNWETVVDFLKAHWMTVVDVFKALLTPAIAILTGYIAYAQYRLAKAKFRHDLYERRSAVYKATMKFIAQVTSSGPDMAEAHTFLRDTSEAAFLFKGKRIPEFLKELYKKAGDLRRNEELAESRTIPRGKIEERADKAHKLRLWFGDQFDECTRLFAPELSLV